MATLPTKKQETYLKDKHKEQAELYYLGLLDRNEPIKGGVVVIPVWDNGLKIIRYKEEELKKSKKET